MSGCCDDAVEKMSVCLKCGDRGYCECLVYCNKCQVSAEHSYCMDKMPSKGEERFNWRCEECFPRGPRPIPVPSRKSERIQVAAEVKLNRVKLRKQISFFNAKDNTYSFSQANQPIGDGSCLKEAIEREPISQCPQQEELRKPRRLFFIEDGGGSDEESEFVEHLVADPMQSASAVAGDSLNVSHSLSSSESDRFVNVKPIVDPIWKGSFNIQNLEANTSVRLVAHLSTNASRRVWDAASTLPVQLKTEILSRSESWPKMFQITPPTDKTIGLYFFPQCERDEKVFDSLVDEMIIQDRVLKAVINDVELLVFSSCELPQEHWRFCQKYYLWGVFKPDKKRC